MDSDSYGTCHLCGAGKRPGKATFTADLASGVVVVRDVAATVCVQCGAEWLLDEAAAEIEKVVDDARKSHRQVEVTTLA